MPQTTTSAGPEFHLSPAGYAVLARLEGNIPYVYDDLRVGPLRPLTSYAEARGTPTIGLGVAIQSEADRQKYAVFLTRRATPAELEAINRTRLAEFEQKLSARLAGARLTQGMFDALFLLMWNTGAGGAALNRAIAALKLGDYAAAQQAIATGPVTSRGQVLEALVRRRALEAQMFAESVEATAEKVAGTIKKNPWPYLGAVGVIAALTFAAARIAMGSR